MDTAKIQAMAKKDAADFINGASMADLKASLQPGQLGADESLINALGITDTAELFGVEPVGPEFTEACSVYARAFEVEVAASVWEIRSVEVTREPTEDEAGEVTAKVLVGSAEMTTTWSTQRNGYDGQLEPAGDSLDCWCDRELFARSQHLARDIGFEVIARANN